MEPSDPPSAPAPAADGDAGAEPAAPFLPTPVIVALLSLSGVLGAALFANWDKVFGGHRAKPAAATAAPSGSTPAAVAADLQRLQGVWLSPVAVHPYQADRRFRLRVILNVFGGEVSGQVSDLPEGRETGPVEEIVSARPVGGGIDFEVSSTWCCEDGKERPFQIFYQLRPTSQGLAVTRRNNVPGGGKVERFLLGRTG